MEEKHYEPEESRTIPYFITAVIAAVIGGLLGMNSMMKFPGILVLWKLLVSGSFTVGSFLADILRGRTARFSREGIMFTVLAVIALAAVLIGAGYLLFGRGWDDLAGMFILFYFAAPLFVAAVIRLVRWRIYRLDSASS